MVARASLFSIVFLFGCSSSSETAPSVTDSGTSGSDTSTTSETGPTDTGAPTEDTGECNALANAAPPITSGTSTATLPMGAGGTIADGTYFLTKETVYGSSGGSMHQETLSIAGGALQIVKIGVTNPTDRTSWTYATSGTTLTLTRTCPSSKTQMLGFTATTTTFTTYDATSNIEKSYTKQ